ncbi:hypothetical protein CROQUDRAFT_713842 [Cronartium quercuum f. sp. fusiforme G11]|uniref:DUF7872 domain-containing protein n=1 Tax=Cronartium quercuum f. sp. fusiforme G11 TaxID=708437 RepID=A0A9P6NSJ1_9BASI|nr:hypothetical protein CROQUDRAFT_713842 [Cronartium quercuum f. sp. fusiforme G11]
MIKPSLNAGLGLCLLGASFTHAFTLHAAPSTQPSSNLTSPSTTTSTNSTPPSIGNSPSNSHKDPNCIAKTLSVETWKELKLDQYLSNYPGGQNITLPQYADSKGEQNFKCGIEEDCNVGQICDPVPAPDWYILLSVQEWNNCMNSVYKAVHFATSVVQGTMALMISELADRNMPPAAWAFDISTLAVLIAALAAVLSLGVDLLFLAGYVGVLSIFLTWFAGISVISGVLGTSGYSLSNLLGQAPPDKREFVKWGEIGNVFSDWESGMHSKISNTTQTVLNAPISSPDGISSVVKGGAFLYSRQTKTTAELQTEYTTVIQARSLVLVLRSMIPKVGS